MNLADYIDSEVAERLKAFLLESRFPVAGAFTGVHRSFLKGTAMEFAELRNYMPGDDLRRMDWKSYARSDKFFLKEYESETNARAYFLLDTSGSMNFAGHDGNSRLTVAKRLIAHLSMLLLAQGDSVGVIKELGGGMIAERIRGESNVYRVLNELEERVASGREDLSEQLHSVSRNLPRRSMVVIVSDFLSPLDELEQALQHLRFHSHDVTCLQVLSERETKFNESSAVAFRGMEGEDVVQTNAQVIKKNYLKKLNQHLEELEGMCKRTQTRYHRVLSETDLEESILQLIL